MKKYSLTVLVILMVINGLSFFGVYRLNPIVQLIVSISMIILAIIILRETSKASKK